MNRRVLWMAAFTLLSWLGLAVHNMVELPGLTLLSPEYIIPGLLNLFLFLGWWKLCPRWIMAILLLGWALFNLIGGAVISVIPFGFLPFYPEQSLRHYFSHVVYGLAQLPLIITLIRELW